MVDYKAFLVLIILSMATTTRCSWISGGAPPPASTGDDYTIGDDYISPSPGGSVKSSKDNGVSPGPSDESTEENDEDDDEAAAGPDSEFMVQEKSTEPNSKEDEPAGGESFIIQGKVYCDPCRIQFPTKISYALAGTKISLVCHKETGEETYRVEGESDRKGKYTIEAVGDHADEICEITVSQSPDPNCPELMDDENHVRVSLTNKHGAKGRGRYANPLGFMVMDADPRCKEALDELGFTGI
uniref:Olee1-like protein n=2 Tax=Tanacetum TaxID=99105 RepID=A0A6L2NUR8_TANCI|nr:olee1-like protein [Tanacetum cinerariifolium]